MNSNANNNELFQNANQAKSYAQSRPTYPPELFERLASLTQQHERAWDVGTGNGQAASMIAEHFKSVVATDVSAAQLGHAVKRPNITYAKMSAIPSEAEVQEVIGAEGSVDLVTVATALHYFDFDSFYPTVKRVLRKPGGIFAAWTYSNHQIDVPEVDKLKTQWYQQMTSFRPPAVQYVFQNYTTIPFPFKPVAGGAVTGSGGKVQPELIQTRKDMDFDAYMGLWQSSSAVTKALQEGVDFLNEDARQTMLKAWGAKDQVRTVTFDIHLLIGTV